MRRTDLVAYFDAGCTLCSGAVAFARRNDPGRRVHFEPLDSPQGRALAPGGGSMLVESGGRIFTGSDAVLAIGERLRFPFPALTALARRMPRGWRERGYRLIAANRYRWFGRCDRRPPEPV